MILIKDEPHNKFIKVTKKETHGSLIISDLLTYKIICKTLTNNKRKMYTKHLNKLFKTEEIYIGTDIIHQVSDYWIQSIFKNTETKKNTKYVQL